MLELGVGGPRARESDLEGGREHKLKSFGPFKKAPFKGFCKHTAGL